MKVECPKPGCRFLAEVTPHNRGRTLRCPDCDTSILVPPDYLGIYPPNGKVPERDRNPPRFREEGRCVVADEFAGRDWAFVPAAILLALVAGVFLGLGALGFVRLFW